MSNRESDKYYIRENVWEKSGHTYYNLSQDLVDLLEGIANSLQHLEAQARQPEPSMAKQLAADFMKVGK